MSINELSSKIADRLLSEKKIAEGATLLDGTDIDGLRDLTRTYFSAELLQNMSESNLFRIPTPQDAESLVQLQELLRSGDEQKTADLLPQIRCPIVEKNIVQKKFKRNDSDQAIVILRDEGNRNLTIATDGVELESYEEAANQSANNVMIIYPGSYGGLNTDGLFIYGMDEGVLKQNFVHLDGDTWQTKPHSLVFATAPREYYGTDDTVETTQSHEGKQNAKPYQFYCHDDLKNPAKAYNADPERFTPVNDDARTLFDILQSEPAQMVKRLRTRIEQLQESQ